MNTKPYPYQREGADFVRDKDGVALIADEMGLGKSLQALLAAHENGWWPVVVVCPASLKWQWARECSHHFNLRSEVLSTTKADRRPVRPPPVSIINYDILGAWLPYLRKLKPKFVILDEADYLQGRRTRPLAFFGSSTCSQIATRKPFLTRRAM